MGKFADTILRGGMGNKAFIYPGQGAQAVGMGMSLLEAFDDAASIFKRSSDVAGYDMRDLCAEGPIEKLSQTTYSQPALFTVEAAVTEVLKSRGVAPQAVAGHSLGEFAAWYAAGAFSFEAGLKLVLERGRLMADADPDGVGTMAAIIGLQQNVVEDVCALTEGVVVVANYNSSVQQVISGERVAVETAAAALKEKGAKRVVPLNVSGAFHSPLMASVSDAFAEVVKNTAIRNATIPVYANVDAHPVYDAAEIKRVMVEQLTSSVRWTDVVVAMKNDGVTDMFELGPGNVLKGLIARIDKDIAVTSIGDAESVEGII